MKNMIMTVAAVALSLSARAEFLYFQANAFSWTGPKLFDYAQVGVAKEGETVWDGSGGKTYLQIKASPDAATSDDFLATDNGDRYHATGWADVSAYKDDLFTFYVETYLSDPQGADDTLVWAYSPELALTYRELLEANHIDDGTTDPRYLTPWVVPEPTGGMLLLLGLASLALRRRKVQG